MTLAPGIKENYSLKAHNTFGIEVSARLFSEINTVTDLQQLLEDHGSTSRLVLGGGSNILFTKNFDGLVIKNNLKGIRVIGEDEDHVTVQVGAGENWHEFVVYCIKNNYGGVENLSLIPGNTGASPMQNIGAYGVELKDVFYELEALHLTDRTIVKFNASDCSFGYRESIFKNKYRDQFIILNVSFRLTKKPVYNTSYGAIQQELERMHVEELSIQAISQAVINIRQSKLPDPTITGNAGSFFKNPEVSKELYDELKKTYPNIVGFSTSSDKMKLAAGWLIEQCGWKGHRRGDAGCHANQALVLVNYGKATGNEILELSTSILESVKARFNVQLEREVNIC